MSSGRVTFIAATLVAVVFAAGLAVGLTRLGGRTQYQSTAVVIIDQPTAIAAVPNAGVLDKLARLRLKYSGLMGTRELQEPIADAAGLDVGQVAGSLSVQVAPDSLLMALRGRANDRDVARAVAEAAAEQLIAYAEDEQADAGIASSDRFAFRVVTPADDARDVTDRRGALLPVVASALGLVVAAGAAVVARRRA